MSPAYYDSNYLLKLQIAEAGSTHVRAHAATVLEIHTAQHARAEFASAAFRKVREGVATAADFQRLMAQLRSDISSTTVVILPLTDSNSSSPPLPPPHGSEPPMPSISPPPQKMASRKSTPTTSTSSPPPRSSDSME